MEKIKFNIKLKNKNILVSAFLRSFVYFICITKWFKLFNYGIEIQFCQSVLFIFLWKVFEQNFVFFELEFIKFLLNYLMLYRVSLYGLWSSSEAILHQLEVELLGMQYFLIYIYNHVFWVLAEFLKALSSKRLFKPVHNKYHHVFGNLLNYFYSDFNLFQKCFQIPVFFSQQVACDWVFEHVLLQKGLNKCVYLKKLL